MVYFSRMQLQSNAPVNSQVLWEESLARTFEYSCLPFPDNLRALGIAMIHHERPDVAKKCPNLERDYDLLMAPVREARKREGMDELYRKYNPRMASELESGGLRRPNL